VVASDMGHTSLVAHESGEVDGLALVVLGEGSYAASVVSCSALGEEGK
jgi:hypothetical protein